MMRKIHLRRTDLLQGADVTLVTEESTYETTVGRGTILGCDDKRVSRNHCSLRILPDGSIFLVAIHSNPCFYKVQGQSGNFKILSRNESITLRHGDEFSLLPESYRYRISTNQEESGNDGSTTLEANGNPLDMTPMCIVEEGTVSANTNQTATPMASTSANRVTPRSRVLPDWLTNLPKSDVAPPLSKARKRKIEQQQNQMDKKQKNAYNERCKDDSSLLDQTIILPEAEPIGNDNVLRTATSATEVAAGSPLLQLDNEPGLASNAQTSCKDDYEAIWGDNGLTTVKVESGLENVKTELGLENVVKTETAENPVKEEPVDNSADPCQGASSSNANVPAPSAAQATVRDRCMYGPACYRKNPQHRADLSHPGDADYDAAAVSLPECEYGTSCYRRNVQHRKDFNHTKTVSPPLPPRPQTNSMAPNIFCENCSIVYSVCTRCHRVDATVEPVNLMDDDIGSDETFDLTDDNIGDDEPVDLTGDDDDCQQFKHED